jgi:hypothetical protein
MAKFPINDLHSFKDYVGFVKLCAPDQFPRREGVSEPEQWSLDLAFDGLRFGLKLAVEEKGERPVFADCRLMVEAAYAEYRSGQMKEGFLKLAEVQKLLKKVPSR